MTPDTYLDNIRHTVVALSPELTVVERELLLHIPIVWEPGLAREELFLDGEIYGNTVSQPLFPWDIRPLKVYVYGRNQKRPYAVEEAFVLLHELGHVITADWHGHDQVWYQNTTRIGVCPWATGPLYTAQLRENWKPHVWDAIAKLPVPDGWEPFPTV